MTIGWPKYRRIRPTMRAQPRMTTSCSRRGEWAIDLALKPMMPGILAAWLGRHCDHPRHSLPHGYSQYLLRPPSLDSRGICSYIRRHVRAYALNVQGAIMSNAEILVSGATGRTGGATVDELLKMGK